MLKKPHDLANNLFNFYPLGDLVLPQDGKLSRRAIKIMITISKTETPLEASFQQRELGATRKVLMRRALNLKIGLRMGLPQAWHIENISPSNWLG